MKPEADNPTDLGVRQVITIKPAVTEAKTRIMVVPNITPADGECNE